MKKETKELLQDLQAHFMLCADLKDRTIGEIKEWYNPLKLFIKKMYHEEDFIDEVFTKEDSDNLIKTCQVILNTLNVIEIFNKKENKVFDSKKVVDLPQKVQKTLVLRLQKVTETSTKFSNSISLAFKVLEEKNESNVEPVSIEDLNTTDKKMEKTKELLQELQERFVLCADLKDKTVGEITEWYNSLKLFIKMYHEEDFICDGFEKQDSVYLLETCQSILHSLNIFERFNKQENKDFVSKKVVDFPEKIQKMFGERLQAAIETSTKFSNSLLLGLKTLEETKEATIIEDLEPVDTQIIIEPTDEVIKIEEIEEPVDIQIISEPADEIIKIEEVEEPVDTQIVSGSIDKKENNLKQFLSEWLNCLNDFLYYAESDIFNQFLINAYRTFLSSNKKLIDGLVYSKKLTEKERKKIINHLNEISVFVNTLYDLMHSIVEGKEIKKYSLMKEYCVSIINDIEKHVQEIHIQNLDVYNEELIKEEHNEGGFPLSSVIRIFCHDVEGYLSGKIKAEFILSKISGMKSILYNNLSSNYDKKSKEKINLVCYYLEAALESSYYNPIVFKHCLRQALRILNNKEVDEIFIKNYVSNFDVSNKNAKKMKIKQKRKPKKGKFIAGIAAAALMVVGGLFAYKNKVKVSLSKVEAAIVNDEVSLSENKTHFYSDIKETINKTMQDLQQNLSRLDLKEIQDTLIAFKEKRDLSTTTDLEFAASSDLNLEYIPISEPLNLKSNASIYSSIKNLINGNGKASHYASDEDIGRYVQSIIMTQNKDLSSALFVTSNEQVDAYLDLDYDVIGYQSDNMYSYDSYGNFKGHEGIWAEEDAIMPSLVKKR